MWPTLIEIPGSGAGAGLHTYGLMVMLGFVAGFGVIQARGRQIGIALDRLIWLYCAAAVGGLLGARLLYAVSVGDPTALWSCSGGLAYYGGVLGGAAAVIGTAKYLEVHVWKLADIALPVVVLGNAVGRLGCFFAGCCHGAALVMPDPKQPLLPDGLLHGQVWLHGHFPFVSTEFHAGVGRILHEPLYPTQIWQSAGAFAVFGVLSVFWHQRRFDGQIAALALTLEPLVRIAVEFFRADHRGYVVQWQVEQLPGWLPGAASAGASLPDTAAAVVVGITTSQFIGLCSVGLGLALLISRRHLGIAPETPLVDEYVDELAP